MGSGFAVASREGNSGADEGEEDNTEGPNIGLEVAGLVFDDLRGHEADGSSHLLDAFIVTQLAGKSEIANLDFG